MWRFGRNLMAALLAALSLAACGTTARHGGELDYADPQIVDDGRSLQCVPFAREASGIGIYGDAWTWWDQAAGRYRRGFTPTEGSVIVLQGYGGVTRGHLAVVRRVVSPRIIVVDHANWHNRGEVTLDAPIRDVSSGNDWSQVQVWYAQGGHWGGRAYRVTGFISPVRDVAGS